MDTYTSETGTVRMYAVRFSPNGEKFLVEAPNAMTAQRKADGLAALHDIELIHGIDVYLATENDITDYNQEEE